MSALPSWARVGAKVVCVDASHGDLYDKGPGLVLGEIYTLRAVTDVYGPLCCNVVGDGFDFGEYMRLDRFRPAVEPKSEVEDLALFKHHLKTPEVVE